MSGKEIIGSVDFSASETSPPEYVKTESGQLVTPEFLAFLQQTLTGKLAEPADADDLDPEVRALAEELSVIHLPEWTSTVGRKLAEPTVTSIKQASRVAEYLIKRGVRVHPELEAIRWVPTPSGAPGAFDTGAHITPDAEGNWPTPDAETFYDFDEISVKQVEGSAWYATHPRGIACEGKTKSEAYAAMVAELSRRIDDASTEPK